MKLYTRTGDKGETSLLGGKRVPKDGLRIEAYGTIDEVNSVLGMAAALSHSGDLADIVRGIQNQLFVVGSDLAAPRDGGPREVRRITTRETSDMEKLIDSLEEKLSPLTAFILPGGTPVAAALHHARTVARRAERLVVRLSRDEDIGESLPIYLNRLSDLLFALARYANRVEGKSDVEWKQ